MLKKLNVTAISALILAGGVFAAQAADPMPTPMPDTPTLPRPSFTDGRINAYDAAAPVVVFETYKEVPIVNDNGVPTTADVVNGVQLLHWDGASAKEVLNVSLDDITAAIDKNTAATAPVVISKDNGYTLSYATGYLWVTTPPDFEGKVYTFSWQKDF